MMDADQDEDHEITTAIINLNQKVIFYLHEPAAAINHNLSLS